MGDCVFYGEWLNFIAKLRGGPTGSINPNNYLVGSDSKDFCEILKNHPGMQSVPNVKSGIGSSQEDAGELLRGILNSEKCENVTKIIKNTFGIYISNRNKCVDQGQEKLFKTKIPEPLVTLDLDIRIVDYQADGTVTGINKLNTLTECLKQDFKEEYISDLACGNLGKIGGYKRTVISALNPLLIVVLKRFAEKIIIRQIQSSIKEKIDHSVSFDLELDLKDYLSENLKTNRAIISKYNLIGIVHHSGTLDGGHYIAYSKDFEGKPEDNYERKWYEYNDSLVSGPKATDEIKKLGNSSGPYILFYEREDVTQEIAMLKKLEEKKNEIENKLVELEKSVAERRQKIDELNKKLNPS